MYNPPNSITFLSDIQACIFKAVQLSWKLLTIPEKYHSKIQTLWSMLIKVVG